MKTMQACRLHVGCHVGSNAAWLLRSVGMQAVFAFSSRARARINTFFNLTNNADKKNKNYFSYTENNYKYPTCLQVSIKTIS